MFSLLWKYILSFFTADKIGVLVRTLLIKSTKIVATDILDPTNQAKAYEFVKELNQRTDINNLQKAVIFNKKMLEWSIKEGRKLGENTINCLREFAVAALKRETPLTIEKPVK